MSNHVLSRDVRIRLAGSIAIVERHRWDITQRMQTHLAACETEDEPFGQGEVTGLMLVELLVDKADELAEHGKLGSLDRVAAEHRRLDIDGRHYSRFGEALAPILRDVLGPSLPPRIASAWCDAFWFIVRELTPQQAREPKAAAAAGWRSSGLAHKLVQAAAQITGRQA